MLSSLLGSLDARGGGLGALSGEARLELCRTLGFDEVPLGTVVCTEGEPGHSFYVVLYGTLEVSQKRGEGDLVREVHLTRLQPGAHFGELALLSDKGARRAATVRAMRPSGLLRIEEADYRRPTPIYLYTCLPTYPSIYLYSPIRPSFFLTEHRRIVRKGQLEALRETMEFVKSVGPFQHMRGDQLEQLCRVLRPLVVVAGEVVQRQGGAAQGLYIVRWGRLVEERHLMLEQGDRREERDLRVRELTRRDVVGELALITPRQKLGTSLRVETQVTCLFLSRSDFSPQLLHDDTMRELRMMAKRHPTDDDLRSRHYQDLEWGKAKRAYVDKVVREMRGARDAERRRR